MIIHGRNVNENYFNSIDRIRCIGNEEDSRNGKVLVAPWPIMTVTDRPTERVLFFPNRDANPFFHFFECLWMMSGSNDGKWLDRFVGDFSSRYGEEDGTIHGAYGARWRAWFDGGMDQLTQCVDQLRRNPGDRRTVVSMWDPKADLGADVKDTPCNTHIYPRIVDGALDITVCCRSNDIIWGATGANAVHFSFVQEWMAAQIGVRVGKMYQLSNNWHAYENTLEKVGVPNILDHYSAGEVAPYPICQVPDAWDEDLQLFMEDPEYARMYANDFFRQVAVPMWLVHSEWKHGRREVAVSLVDNIAATDWREAARAWMQRRIDRAVK